MNDIVEDQDEVNEYLDLLDEDDYEYDDDYDFDFDDDDYDDDFDDEEHVGCINCGEEEE